MFAYGEKEVRGPPLLQSSGIYAINKALKEIIGSLLLLKLTLGAVWTHLEDHAGSAELITFEKAISVLLRHNSACEIALPTLPSACMRVYSLFKK